MKKAEEFIYREFPEDQILRAQLHFALGLMLIQKKEFKPAVSNLHKSNEIYDLMVGDYHEAKHRVLNALSVAYCQSKDYEPAL